MKILDWYILKRYLTTFLLMILLFIPIAITVNLAEKIDKISKNQSVTLISYSPGYFLIDEPRGYLLALALNKNKEIEK